MISSTLLEKEVIVYNLSKELVYKKIASWMIKNKINITLSERPSTLKGIYGMESKTINDIEISPTITIINIKETGNHVLINIKLDKFRSIGILDYLSIDRFYYDEIISNIINEFDYNIQHSFDTSKEKINVLRLRNVLLTLILIGTAIIASQFRNLQRLPWILLYIFMIVFYLIEIIKGNIKLRKKIRY